MQELEIARYKKMFEDNFQTQTVKIDILKGIVIFEKICKVDSFNIFTENKITLTDECFIAIGEFISSTQIIEKRIEKNGFAKSYNLASNFFTKSFIQSMDSIIMLVKKNYYIDSLVLLRSFISKVNLLLLILLNPDLWEDWKHNPKKDIYLDGKIRQELENNGLYIGSHFYELLSEITHGQAMAFIETGYWENDTISMENKHWEFKIFTILKFLISTVTFINVEINLIDKEFNKQDSLFQFKVFHDEITEIMLSPNRLEHFLLGMAEDRHWNKVGKDKYDIGSFMSMSNIIENIHKFYRKGQKKKLSKNYNR